MASTERSPWLVLAAATLCGMLCYREYRGIAAESGIKDLGPVGFAAGLGVLALPDGAAIFLTVLALTGRIGSNNQPDESLNKRGFIKFPGRVITEVVSRESRVTSRER